MYIISLSETWHPFIHFLEKNNLSGFFLWKNSFGHQEYMLQVLDMAVARGICSQTSQSTWGWGMICWLVDPNLNHGLQEWFGQSSPVFFWVVTPPPFYHWTLWQVTEAWEDMYCLALASGAVSVLFEAIPEGGVFGSRGDLWEPAPWVKSNEVPSGKETHHFFKNEVHVHVYNDDYES